MAAEMNKPDPTGRDWPGIVALVLAVVSLVAFATFMIVSGPPPKSLVYNPDLLFEIYMASPLISGVAGTSSIVAAIFALRRSSLSLKTSVALAMAGILLFLFVTVITANVMSTLAPASPGAKSLAADWPSLALSPPVLGMGVLLIAMAVLLARLEGVSGHRPAIAAMIAGGAVTSYFLLNFGLQSLSGE